MLEIVAKVWSYVNMCDKFQSSAVILAVFSNHTRCVDLLLKAGADVNKRDFKGCNVLVWAADKGYDQIVERLIEVGADVNCLLTREPM